MLAVDGVTKVLPDGRKLLEQIRFNVARGEFVAILGSSGAGKSLTLRCIAGLTKPEAGDISVTSRTGEVFRTTNVRARALRQARRHIGMIFQGSNLVKRLSVLENVMMGRLGQINPMRSWTIGFLDREAEEAMHALAAVKMTDFAARMTGSLSGGEMQRVAIARAIYQRPLIYLADEPISSLDPKNSELIMTLLEPLARDAMILGAFHQPTITARYCTRVIGLRAGVIVYDGPPLLREDELDAIYGSADPQVAGKTVAVKTGA